MFFNSDPARRKRFSPEAAFHSELASSRFPDGTPAQAPFVISPNPYYHYHRGDFFAPGAPGFVLDQRTENPLMCIWGNGTLLRPNRGMPVYGTVQNGLEPHPIQEPFLPRVATPWGAGLATLPPGLRPYSFEIQNTGSLQPGIGPSVGVPFGTPSQDLLNPLDY